MPELTEADIREDVRGELYGLDDDEYDDVVASGEARRLLEEFVESFTGERRDQAYNEELEVISEAIAQQIQEE